ncbi:MAG TPA: cytochrome c [Anaeromyxobacter sp.]
MKRTLLALAVVAFASSARAEEAAALFQKKCVACHGKDGKGSPAGRQLGAKDLTATKLSEPDIEGVISNGRGKMTPFKGRIDEPDIKALAKYVKGGLK